MTLKISKNIINEKDKKSGKCNNNFRIKPFSINHAFTLAELMIILLIISLILAAFLPVMTRRSKRGTLWQYISASNPGATHKSIYINEGTVSGVVIGANSLNGDNARLVLNTPDDSQNHMLFKLAGITYGRLILDSQNNTGLGDVTISENLETVIGSGAKASGGKSSAFGQGAQATAAGSTAIGKSAKASKVGALAIGGYALVNGTNSLAIGKSANATTDSCTVIGAIANPLSYGCTNATLVGYKTRAISGSVAVGNQAMALGVPSTAIGNGAVSSVNRSIAIGGSGIANSTSNLILLGDANQNTVINGNLQIYGTVYIHNTINGWPGYLTTTAGGNVYVSDRRLKNVGKEFPDGLEKIKKLNTYNYTFKKEKEKIPHVGVMAQDLQKVFPKSVFKGKDGYLKIRYSEMFYAMVNSVKQLDKTVKGITKDLKTLSAQYNVKKIENKVILLMNNNQRDVKRIKELETENNRLEAHLAKLEKLAKRR